MRWTQARQDWKKVSKRSHTRRRRRSDEDLKVIDGKRDELVRRLQRLYALDRAKAEEVVEDFVKGRR